MIKQKHDAWVSIQKFCKFRLGKHLFYKFSKKKNSPNKDKIRDFELFYQPPYHDTIVYSLTSIFINTLKLLNVETIYILTLIVRGDCAGTFSQ